MTRFSTRADAQDEERSGDEDEVEETLRGTPRPSALPLRLRIHQARKQPVTPTRTKLTSTPVTTPSASRGGERPSSGASRSNPSTPPPDLPPRSNPVNSPPPNDTISLEDRFFSRLERAIDSKMSAGFQQIESRLRQAPAPHLGPRAPKSLKKGSQAARKAAVDAEKAVMSFDRHKYYMVSFQTPCKTNENSHSVTRAAFAPSASRYLG